MHKYETNLASEFYVMAALYRKGADAALSLGNKKAVDITVIRDKGEALTIDVKGVAGKHDWPADNIDKELRPRHFVVFVSFNGKFDDPKVPPSIWIVPHADVEQFRSRFPGGRVNVSRAKLTANGGQYEGNWEPLLSAETATRS